MPTCGRSVRPMHVTCCASVPTTAASRSPRCSSLTASATRCCSPCRLGAPPCWSRAGPRPRSWSSECSRTRRRCSSPARPSSRPCSPPTSRPTLSARCACARRPVRRCRRRSTGASPSASASRSWTASDLRRRCTSSCPTGTGRRGPGRPELPSRAMTWPCGTSWGSRSRMASREHCSCGGPPWRRATGVGPTPAARCSRASGSARATPTCVPPTVTTPVWGVLTTCSKSAGSGCLPPRWRTGCCSTPMWRKPPSWRWPTTTSSTSRWPSSYRCLGRSWTRPNW